MEINDHIRITKKGNTTNLEGVVHIVTFLDKETNQTITYVPSLDMSGYGNSREEAHEMIQFSINSYFNDIIKLSRKELENEFIKLGWSNKERRNKVFEPKFNIESKIDDQGIKNYNTQEVKIAA